MLERGTCGFHEQFGFHTEQKFPLKLRRKIIILNNNFTEEVLSIRLKYQ